MDPNDDSSKPSALQRYTEDGMNAALIAAGGLLGLHPETCQIGIAVSAAAPVVSRKAGEYIALARAYMLGRGEERVHQTAEEVNVRLEEEGLDDRKDSLKDFWTEAIPILQDATAQAMRDMVRDLAITTARHDNAVVATVEACHALGLLRNMDYLTAPLFVWLGRDLLKADPELKPPEDGQITGRCEGPFLLLPNEQDYHGLPFHMWHWGLAKLKHQSHIEFDQYNGDWLVGFTEQGQWLRDRILDRRREADATTSGRERRGRSA